MLFVMTLGVFVFDWRLGLIFLMGAILSLAIIHLCRKREFLLLQRQRKAKMLPMEKVVEYLHGLSIYKLFPGSRQQSVNVEKAFWGFA